MNDFELPPLREPDQDLVKAARAGINALLRRNGRMPEPEEPNNASNPNDPARAAVAPGVATTPDAGAQPP